ncbi:hypothetical protein GCM10020229_62580 [Kitasatospora albolonga]
MQSVGADHRGEPPGAGPFEVDGDAVAVLGEGGDGVVEEVLGVGRGGLVEQAGEVTAEDLDLGDDALAAEGVGGQP